ncbi:cell division control protein 48 homolog C-like isoform X2 [Neltuma alba]|uniref:cell division control protein 48 homolog C-like isoform X2 n=1 Tax=Neltuma alba TaxID=207710 RepID=UPI0010A372D0|nr:cell division control protein 48 homolog C-like isoform X2 [Prosopis alba]
MMKMGRNHIILRRRVESCKSRYSTLDEIVSHLRSNYPDYRRTKQQILTRSVQEALESFKHGSKQLNKKPSASVFKFDTSEDDKDDEEEGWSASRKRRKKIDESEENLQKMENLHLKKLQRDQGHTSTSSASTSSPSLSSESKESDGEDGALSTSEDAIYGEKVEPAVDLMKTMLRASYSESKKVKSKMEEKNVEFEVANNSKATKIDAMDGTGGGMRSDLESKRQLKDSFSNGSGDLEVKGKGGPRFKDLGGMKKVLEELKMEVIVPLYHPQLPRRLGVRPIAGILLHGPPGCGKTTLAHAIANETGFPFYQISATELVSGVSGASEENIRELFSKAYRTAPSIVFIDEIDAIASKRENLQREMEKRIVTQLMTSMDQSNRLLQPADSSESSDAHPGYILVIGATNRPDAVDPALRRPGRFDREIVLGVPDEHGREEILFVLTRNLKLEGSFDLRKIARSTPGFVGADLAALVNKAGNLAMRRIIVERKCELSQDPLDERSEEWWREPWSPEEMDKLLIEMSDFEEAVKLVQPSSRREGFSSIPNVKWEDIGGLDLLRREFERYIVRRIKYPEDYEEFGVNLETGFLLYGPPGCGKTLIAKAVAHEAGANFIHIKGPELLNKYVGESELAVRTLFSRARTCSPCILFFDEVDALTTKRGKEGGWVVERLLNQLLIELDGAEQRQGVFVIGATNRPEVMDRALLRPGRLGKLLYVPLPSPDERGLILKALARKKPIDETVDLCAIGRMEACENLSGADLAAVMNEAAVAAAEEKWTTESTCNASTIKFSHFEMALRKISPSVSDMQKLYYQRLSESFKAA